MALVAALLVAGGSRDLARSMPADTSLVPLAIASQPDRPPFEAAELMRATQWSEGAPPSDRVSAAALRWSGNRYAVVAVEFRDAASCRRFNVPGIPVMHRFQRFANVLLPILPDRGPEDIAKMILQIHDAPGFVWVEPIQLTVSPPPQKLAEGPPSRQVPEEIARGGVDSLTGKGVLLAIVDSGIDFRHPDFIREDAEGKPVSRILYLWDTTAPPVAATRAPRAPVRYPDRSPVGVVYTRAELTAELRATSPRLASMDLNGHGTACASIAAGNGRGAPGWAAVRGVAPDADLVAVRVSRTPGEGIDNGYLLNAICAWLDTLAGPRPLVVSCSFGGRGGGHDGQLIEERELDAQFPLSARGRAIVVAAGNERTSAAHAELQLGGDPVEVTWRAGATWSLRAYMSDADSTNDIAGESSPGIQFGAWVNPLTHQKVIEFQPAWGPGPEGKVGRYGLSLYSRSGRPITVDLYLVGGAFRADAVTEEKLVTAPGTASHAITVGSYDWNDVVTVSGRRRQQANPCDSQKSLDIGGLSCYSSPGFRRNGLVKPDLVAPGEFYYASCAHLADGRRVQPTDASSRPLEVLADSSGRYRVFDGTSAATPYVAGCVALMFEKNPRLTLRQVHELIGANLSRDPFTRDLPNPSWGKGKLDLPAIRRILRAVPPAR